jgi:hypothetical protein
LGNGEQGNRGRKEERIGPGQENQSELIPERRQEGRQSFGIALEVVAFVRGSEGGFDSETQSRRPQEHEPQPVERQPQQIEPKP